MGSSLSCFRPSKPKPQKEETPKPNTNNTNTNTNDNNDKTAPSLMITTPTDPTDITDHSTFTTPYYRTPTPANWPLTSPSPLQTPQTPPRNTADATTTTTPPTSPTTRTPIYDNYIGGAVTVGSHFDTPTTPTTPTPTTSPSPKTSNIQNPGPGPFTVTATNSKTRIPQLAPLPFTQTPPRTTHQYQPSGRDTSRLPHRSHSGGDGGIHAPPNNDPSPQSGRSYLCNSGGGDGGGGRRRRGE
ncbi:hypothetical protein EG328_001348 [Venturia inaequalis]|uniref:Uncharacterized protein n=1 Tax=Venturia inaequalis TaxID=5025 RepID=A0A8H3UZR2_VENIN|nr:hypothetical protein EG328_001348 [Venturia inaequalis]